MGERRKHTERDYFVATHCTMAVTGISQMHMYHIWLSSLRNHDWENNYWKHRLKERNHVLISVNIKKS